MLKMFMKMSKKQDCVVHEDNIRNKLNKKDYKDVFLRTFLYSSNLFIPIQLNLFKNILDLLTYAFIEKEKLKLQICNISYKL